MDFARKICDFEAALQGIGNEDKWVLASRAKLIYLAAWLLGDSSLSCLASWATHRLAAWRCVGISAHRLVGWSVYRQIGSSLSWLVGSSVS